MTLTHLNRWAAVAVLALVLAVGAGLVGGSLVTDSTKLNCEGIQGLKRVLYGIVQKSDESLASISYYRDHPSELKLVQSEDARTLIALRPHSC